MKTATNETTTGAGPTPGTWHRCGIDGAGHEWVSAGGPVPIAQVYPQGTTEEHRRAVAANAALIAEAGTVHHETGKTPRQLADALNELVSVAHWARDMFNRAGVYDGLKSVMQNDETRLYWLNRLNGAVNRAEGGAA
jgi:hypothetical protein